ncbi:MAG: DUF6156 family protein [Methylomonas sp.]|jgi:hypothetical protein
MSANTERYFISYSGVKLPLNLVNELNETDRENRNTFFRACYDAQERLLLCQKLVYSEIELEHRYEYHDNGILSKAEITDADGELTVLLFSSTGEALKN